MSDEKKAGWIHHTREMRKSIAWRHLSDKAIRVLLRLEEEHLDHGGKENGRLVVTYEQFREYGLKRREDIAKAIRMHEALGFVQKTEQGGFKRGERWPNRYRLTYLPTWHQGERISETNDWRKIKTPEQAKAALARAARPARSSTAGGTTYVVPYPA